ncbi:MAG: LemA family protein [Hoeflea sp.]|uniref:LemA family protein n=1 Tax=Hoeflea sp. TaxID=1940281 RepID=UPI0032EBF958
MTFMLLVLLTFILIFILIQNRLVRAQYAVTSAYSGIQVQLKRRHDLVPALVEAVRSAIAQENRIFDRILEVREAAVKAADNGLLGEMETAEAALSNSIRPLLGYMEQHPDVTSTGNVRELQKQLEETEDQIAASRRIYNGNVEYYNTKLDAIPSNWVGSMLKMQKAKFFTLSDAEEKSAQAMPQIDLPGAQA